MTRVLVTGATGQLGHYAARSLAARGCEVVGLRGPSGRSLPEGVVDGGALTLENAATIVETVSTRFGELHAILHLAAPSRVGASFDAPLARWEEIARLGVAVAEGAARAKARFVHASSAEIFAGSAETHDERTRPCPRSPYGAAKAAVHLYVEMLREGRGAHATNVVFYNAESERRGADFVFGKIARGVAAVKAGLATELTLGNTSAVRDFSHARDLAEAAARLSWDGPAGDFIAGSGEGHAIAEVAGLACAHLGLDPERVLRVDASLLRPHDAPRLVGDPSALRRLGWRPTLDFEGLVRTITDHHFRALSGDATENG